MSEFQEAEMIKTGYIPLMEIVMDVVEELGWIVTKSGETWISVREKDRFDYYNPLEMTIEILERTHDSMELSVRAVNAGYGPVQDEYIKSQVKRFLDSVMMTAEGNSKGDLQSENGKENSLSNELARLAKLHDEGKLTEEEYRKAKDKVLNV